VFAPSQDRTDIANQYFSFEFLLTLSSGGTSTKTKKTLPQNSLLTAPFKGLDIVTGNGIIPAW
jgi:hypothetical protein